MTRDLKVACVCQRVPCICLDERPFTLTDEHFIPGTNFLQMQTLPRDFVFPQSAAVDTDISDAIDVHVSNDSGVPAPLFSASLCRWSRDGGGGDETLEEKDAEVRIQEDRIHDDDGNVLRGPEADCEARGVSSLPPHGSADVRARWAASNTNIAAGVSALGAAQAHRDDPVSGMCVPRNAGTVPATRDKNLFPNLDVVTTQQIPLKL